MFNLHIGAYCSTYFWPCTVLICSLFLFFSQQNPPPLRGRQPSLSVSGDSGCLRHSHQRHWPVGALCPALCGCLGPGQEVRGPQLLSLFSSSFFLTWARRGGGEKNLGIRLLLPHIETWWSTPLCFHGNQRWQWGGDSHAWPPGSAAWQFKMQRAARHPGVIHLLVGISCRHRNERGCCLSVLTLYPL